MTLYSVYERSGDAPLAVADRFSWFAALLPPVHAIVHGLWPMLGLWVLGTLAIGLLGLLVGADAASWLYMLFAVFLGFEASAFRRTKAARAGAHYRGEQVAADQDLALVDYLRFQSA